MREINIDLGELEKEKEKNFKERLRFISYWVKFIKEHTDEEWSEQQNIIINSQMPTKVKTEISSRKVFKV